MASRGRKKDIEKEPIAKVEKTLTPEQLSLVRKIRQGKKDPVFFAERVLGIQLHPKQMVWLWMTTKTQLDNAAALGIQLKLWDHTRFKEMMALNPEMMKNILVPSNRWGKTLVTSVKHIWYNYYKVGVQGETEHIKKTRCGTLNLSPHSNQADAAYQYILDILFSKFTFRSPGPDGVMVSKVNECLIPDFYIGDNSQKRAIVFKNGTTFKAVPTGEDQAASLAGTRFLYISYDECAQSLHLKQELPAKIMSRLIDFGGPLDLISTPEVDKPSHQYFFHIAKLGLQCKDGWFTLIGNLMDNIFLGAVERDMVANTIKQTDPVKYRQVVYGEFVTTGKKMFDSLTIERLWDGEQREYPQQGRDYLVWADWGFADTGDPTVFYVLDFTPTKMMDGTFVKNRYRIAYREAVRGGSPFALLAQFRYLKQEWSAKYAGHDSGNMGGIMVKKMLREMGMADLIDFSATGDKGDMLFCLLVVLSDGRKTTYDSEGKVTDHNVNFGRLRSYYIPELEEQMGNYQYNPDKGVTDKRIEQDDVMCLGMAVWWLERRYNRSTVKMGEFNPLASSISQILPEKIVKELSMRTLAIPEKRIF
jgi:hypothetical protein